jgi:DNA repair exonuclease SbcCD ATPase subunit
MSETNNETAEIIKDLQSKAVPIKGNTADFLAKFTQKQTDAGIPSAANVGDPMLGRQEEVSNDTEEETIVNDNEEKRSLIQPEKKKSGFVQKQIEENKRLKEELEKFKSEEIPKYTSKIEELEKLVQNSQTTAEANHYQSQLNKANEEKIELEQNLSKEIQELRSKLDFHDLTTNPDFQKQFVEPIQKSYNAARQIIGNDTQLLNIFQRAIASNASMYNHATEEDRAAAMRERDEAFEEITNSLGTFKQVRFADAIKDYLDSTVQHAQALINHTQTKQEIEAQAKRKAQEARSQFINTWRDSYKKQAEEVENEISISDDIQTYMKEKGISYDTSRDDAIALSATQQSNDEASVDEMNRLINQGRAYKKLQAQVKALQEMVKEKDSYIKSLKGASRVDSTPKVNESQQRRMSISEGLAAKLSKFSPASRTLVNA